MTGSKSNKLTVNEQLDLLLNGEAEKTPCDETIRDPVNTLELPPWYDKNMFKRGQQYYHDNIFSMFLSKLCGLVCVLAIPSILKLLIFTEKSSEPMTAYKRYVATIFHMCIWYDSEFTPDSKLWKSLREVRNLHNFASRRGCKAGKGQISQRDMALTQFGFMGYAVIKPYLLGIHADPEGAKGLVHLWRVIGWLLGIEDRFNICRESVDETKELCQALNDRVFAPAVRSEDKTFINMSCALLRGMWCVNPLINEDAMFAFLFDISRPTKSYDDSISDPKTKPKRASKEWLNSLSTYSQFILFLMYTLHHNLLNYTVIRLYYNSQMYLALFLTKWFPFLAYYCFGMGYSHAPILKNVQHTIKE